MREGSEWSREREASEVGKGRRATPSCAEASFPKLTQPARRAKELDSRPGGPSFDISVSVVGHF